MKRCIISTPEENQQEGDQLIASGACRDLICGDEKRHDSHALDKDYSLALALENQLKPTACKAQSAGKQTGQKRSVKRREQPIMQLKYLSAARHEFCEELFMVRSNLSQEPPKIMGSQPFDEHSKVVKSQPDIMAKQSD
ncbi:hypothetical protein VTO42DRAFT_9043 [Malbranchea cinnamomea]